MSIEVINMLRKDRNVAFFLSMYIFLRGKTEIIKILTCRTKVHNLLNLTIILHIPDCLIHLFTVNGI